MFGFKARSTRPRRQREPHSRARFGQDLRAVRGSSRLPARSIRWSPHQPRNGDGNRGARVMRIANRAMHVLRSREVGRTQQWTTFRSRSATTYTTKRAALLAPRTKSFFIAGSVRAAKEVTRWTRPHFRVWSTATCTRDMAEPRPGSSLRCGTAPTNFSPSLNARPSDEHAPVNSASACRRH
jgi:hypothetical protein